MFPLILTFNFDLIFNQYWLLGVQIGYLDRVNFFCFFGGGVYSFFLFSMFLFNLDLILGSLSLFWALMGYHFGPG